MIYSYFQSPEVAVCVSSAVTREVHFVKESLIMTKMGEQEITVCLAANFSFNPQIRGFQTGARGPP